jgi:hypothetical protein
MIDLIINDASGIIVAHDDPSLDNFDTILFNQGEVSLSGPNGIKNIGKAAPAMLSILKKDMVAKIIRLKGYAMARPVPLCLVIVD